MRNLIIFVLVVLMSISTPLLAKGWGKGGGNNTGTSALTIGEEQHLTFMREEEKLARDVYTTFSQKYPRSRVFGNIDNSEQQHTTAVKNLLTKYGVADPSTNDNVGVFTGENYGEYFTEKYTLLVNNGSVSELDALYAGAFIEELDMLDILECNQVIIDATPELNSPEDCGLNATTKTDVSNTLTNLLNGSKSHLRAYVKNIERRIGVGNYEAQLLSQEIVDEILGR